MSLTLPQEMVLLLLVDEEDGGLSIRRHQNILDLNALRPRVDLTKHDRTRTLTRTQLTPNPNVNPHLALEANASVPGGNINDIIGNVISHQGLITLVDILCSVNIALIANDRELGLYSSRRNNGDADSSIYNEELARGMDAHQSMLSLNPP